MIGITSTSNTSRRTGLLVGSVLLTFFRVAGAYGYRWPGSSSTTTGRELNHLSKKPRFRLIELIAG